MQNFTSSGSDQEIGSLLHNLQNDKSLAIMFQKIAKEQLEESESRLTKPLTLKNIYRVIVAARKRLKRENENSPLAVLRECESGCNACCFTTKVDTTPLEALVLAEYLVENLNEDSLRKTRNRLRQNAENVEKMSSQERTQSRLRCGLLDDKGQCQVYESRPIVCAGVYSFSRDACAAAYLNTDANDYAKIPLDQPAKTAAMGISGGLQRAIVNAGLDGNLYELNSIVHRALETPDAIRRWLRKEDIFKGCVCTDRHSPPRKRKENILRIDSASVPEPNILKHLKNQKNRNRSA